VIAFLYLLVTSSSIHTKNNPGVGGNISGDFSRGKRSTENDTKSTDFSFQKMPSTSARLLNVFNELSAKCHELRNQLFDMICDA
jgi:hypothetical protein